jgi:asparagine synthase (glutamine-hydrolysing)
MDPYLPQEIVWRKDKQGFVNPQSEWLKQELKPGVLSYFSEESLIFKNQLVNRDNLLVKYKEYCQQRAGQGRIWFKEIFNCLSLEIWLRKFAQYIV